MTVITADSSQTQNLTLCNWTGANPTSHGCHDCHRGRSKNWSRQTGWGHQRRSCWHDCEPHPGEPWCHESEPRPPAPSVLLVFHSDWKHTNSCCRSERKGGILGRHFHHLRFAAAKFCHCKGHVYSSKSRRQFCSNKINFAATKQPLTFAAANLLQVLPLQKPQWYQTLKSTLLQPQTFVAAAGMGNSLSLQSWFCSYQTTASHFYRARKSQSCCCRVHVCSCQPRRCSSKFTFICTATSQLWWWPQWKMGSYGTTVGLAVHFALDTAKPARQSQHNFCESPSSLKGTQSWRRQLAWKHK